MSATTLAVSEVFGPTLQGEGPSAGRPAAFLRLAGCNLACAWCDTAYTWDWTRYDRAKEVRVLPLVDVAELVMAALPPSSYHRLPLLVVTGGEPMLQQVALDGLMSLLPILRLEVETAGTRAPLPAFGSWVTQWNVSVKLAHSGNDRARRLVPEALVALSNTGLAVWKFVARTPADLDEAEAIVNQWQLKGDVYVMPEGTTPEGLRERGRQLAPHVISRGWRLTSRLHVDLWGTERGR